MCLHISPRLSQSQLHINSTEPPKYSFSARGQEVRIYPLAKIVNADRLEIGNRVIIDDFVFLDAGEHTRIGSFVHIAAFASLVGGGRLIIEDFAGISGGVRIYTGNEQYGGQCLTGPTVPTPFRIPIRGSVIIKRHAIIGANSVILPGLTIGEGAVVGACSLVTKNCEPWTVNFGTPAKKIRIRPSAEILRLETELRAKFYRADGTYIPNPDAT